MESKDGRALLTVACAPMQFSDSNKQHRHDAQAIFGQGWDVVGGTETGPGSGNLREMLAEASLGHGYRLFMPDQITTWVAVKRNLVVPRSYKTEVIPVIKNSAQEGSTRKFSARGLAAIEFKIPGVGVVGVSAAHYLTSGRKPGRFSLFGRASHWSLNRKTAAAIGDWGRAAGRGNDLAFTLGDYNMIDRVSNVYMGEAKFTTCWDELKKWPATNESGENIDAVASWDADGRVRCEAARVLKDNDLSLYTDHRPTVAKYSIALQGAR